MSEVALITGASSGIGYEIARCFVMRSIDVIFVARSAEKRDAALYDGHVMTASKVAEAGFKGMMAGKLHVVPGLNNKFMALLSSMTPSRQQRLAAADRIMKPRQS